MYAEHAEHVEMIDGVHHGVHRATLFCIRLGESCHLPQLQHSADKKETMIALSGDTILSRRMKI